MKLVELRAFQRLHLEQTTERSAVYLDTQLRIPWDSIHGVRQPKRVRRARREGISVDNERSLMLAVGIIGEVALHDSPLAVVMIWLEQPPIYISDLDNSVQEQTFCRVDVRTRVREIRAWLLIRNADSRRLSSNTQKNK